jgi:hypothetical protein
MRTHPSGKTTHPARSLAAGHLEAAPTPQAAVLEAAPTQQAAVPVAVPNHPAADPEAVPNHPAADPVAVPNHPAAGPVAVPNRAGPAVAVRDPRPVAPRSWLAAFDQKPCMKPIAGDTVRPESGKNLRSLTSRRNPDFLFSGNITPPPSPTNTLPDRRQAFSV